MVTAETSRPSVRFFSPETVVPTTKIPLEAGERNETSRFSRAITAAQRELGKVNITRGENEGLEKLAYEYRQLTRLTDPTYPPIKPWQTITIQEVCVRRVRAVGAMLLLRDNLERQREILVRGIEKSLLAGALSPADLETARILSENKPKRFIRLLELGFTAELETPISEVRIVDIESVRPAEEEPAMLADHFRFLVESILIEKNKRPPEITLAQTDELMKDYPLLAKDHAIATAGKINALNELTPQVVQGTKQAKAGGLESACLQKIIPLMEILQRLRERIYGALLDPNSKDFEAVKKVIEDYQSRGADETTIVLAVAGPLSQDTRLITGYRRAKEYVEEGIYAPFFKKVMEELQEAAEEKPFVSAIIADPSDLPMILEDAAAETSLPPLGQLMSFLRQNGVRDFTVKGATLAGPSPAFKSVRLQLEIDNPNEFEMVLAFTDRHERERNLIVSFDTQKNVLDWSVLEDIARYPAWAKFLTKIAHDTLSARQEEIVQGKALRQVASPATTNAHPAIRGVPGFLNKPRPEAPLTLDRKNGKNRRPPARPLLRETTTGDFRVSLPNKGKKLSKLAKGLKPQELELIMAALTGNDLPPNSLISLSNDPRKIGATHLVRAVGFRLFLRKTSTNNHGRPSFVIVRIDRGT